MQIIGLTGHARSGKDATAQALVDDGWTRIAFADALKDCALALNPWVATDGGNFERLSALVDSLGWDEAKTIPDVRRLLQVFGTEVGREHFGDRCWVDIVAAKLAVLPEDARVVVTDVRFPNEAAFVSELGGQVVRIERPGVGPVNGHASEQTLDASQIIVNSGDLDDLRVMAQSAALLAGTPQTSVRPVALTPVPATFSA